MGVEFIRFDMSEYQEKHSVSKFIGSPPGYVGYADGGSGSGVLINELERHPHSVILLDEIEKAHPDIVNIFLQIMDNGIISSQSGKSASARNTFIIFTSNLGSVSMEKSNIGFGNSERTDQGHEAVKNWFAPEFRNRLDAVIEFGRLSKDSMGKILDKFISQLNDLSSQKKVNIVFDSKAKDWLIDRGFDRNMGARPLTRVIQEHVKKPISREILFGSLKQGGGVMFTVHEDKLQYTIIETAPELTNLLTSTVEGTEECIPQ
jgi:ATP-dependent Clp protease ATP-binding subunit ClpA